MVLFRLAPVDLVLSYGDAATRHFSFDRYCQRRLRRLGSSVRDLDHNTAADQSGIKSFEASHTFVHKGFERWRAVHALEGELQWSLHFLDVGCGFRRQVFPGTTHQSRGLNSNRGRSGGFRYLENRQNCALFRTSKIVADC
jgi:hypothetical protein